ncbi:phosphopantetheine-binding protein [Kibdelosporangium aridum]|uniref:phosphopantetheine-binding protein n=1 Tax=Kibdelosporangium aridum TaxID=2030 RepID=UPI000526A575
MDSIEDAVVRIVTKEAQEYTGGPVTMDTELGSGGLGLSSLGLIRVLVCIEDELDADFDDEQVMSANIRTVRDIVSVARDCAGSLS